MRVRSGALAAVVAALVLAGCGGPGSDAVFDADAPGGEQADVDDAADSEEPSRPVVRGREQPQQGEADLGEYAERACGRAVTGSGRYSQSGYDRGIKEGVEAGLDEAELVDAIEALCGDRIREAQGE